MANRDDDFYYGPYYSAYWWNAPTGWTDYDLYDYNNDMILEDNEIADEVTDNIYSDPGITYMEAGRIKVSVKDGVVTLMGDVRNPRTVPYAYTDAFWSTGVVDVNNQLKVKRRQSKGGNREGGRKNT